MNITNQKPVVLSPIYQENINKDFDPIPTITEIFGTPMFTPMIAGHPVTITENGNNITENEIASCILQTCDTSYNANAEKMAKELFTQSLVNYNRNTKMNTNEIFVVQSGTAAKLPEPDDRIIYTPAQDVIPTSRKFMTGQCDYDEWFASLAYYARPETLGFYFINEVAFEEFKKWMANQMLMVGAVLPADTNQMAADFQTLVLKDLTESLLLRAQDTDNRDPKCFARLIVMLLMQYTQIVSPAEFGVLPFNVPELLCPKSVVFVNVERHAKATARQVANEWKLITNSIKMRPQMISNKKLKRLTAAQRNLQKISSQAVTSAQNAMANAQRSANIRFSSIAPTSVDITKHVKKIMQKMAFVTKSMNIYKSVKSTYAKPNRRDPDDFNKTGKVVSTRYKPDIHLYIDTSGSISEKNYEEIVRGCITMAKAMNVNLYFNSFSHIMSQTTRLKTKDKTKNDIYKEFRKVPKVSGGTDYEQIWHFINGSKKRTREISLIITDFEYTPPSRYIRHPKNLYYVPCSHQDWNNITYWANQFCQGMMNKEPSIRKHILF